MEKTILVAEDDAFLIKMYQRIIERNGWKAVIASDGEETIKRLSASVPDVLVLDLHMPKVDGFAVLEHINAKKMRMPVIVLTNLSHEVDQMTCKKLGAEEFFVKSDMELEDLAKLIRKHVKKS